MGVASPHQEITLKWYLGLLYTRSQGQKIKAKTFLGCKLAPRVVNWPLKCDGILFSALGRIQGLKAQHLLVLGQIEKLFYISASTLSVKLLGLISTFAPIGMLDLG
jgi:hypothetical protein